MLKRLTMSPGWSAWVIESSEAKEEMNTFLDTWPDRERIMSDLRIVDYIDAISGEGPLAGDWEDKPHRLIYDLCAMLGRENPNMAQRQRFRHEFVVLIDEKGITIRTKNKAMDYYLTRSGSLSPYRKDAEYKDSQVACSILDEFYPRNMR